MGREGGGDEARGHEEESCHGGIWYRSVKVSEVYAYDRTRVKSRLRLGRDLDFLGR